MSLTITRCARVKDVPAELAEAFRSMPHYLRQDPARDGIEVEDTGAHRRWDPLSTEGPNRTALYLTGFARAGQHATNGLPVYVLRFGHARFATYTLGRIMEFGNGTKVEAEQRATAATTLGPVPQTWPTTPEERRAFAAWQAEVANGDTVRGFRDWTAAQAEADAA